MKAEQATVLVVDDELGPRESLQTVLERDYQVLSAAEGVEALKILAETPVDVVLLDLRMPGLPGIKVLERIKGIDPDIEVIVVTGYASYDSLLEGLRLKVFDYVAKPFDVPQLLALVRRALDRRISRLQLKRIKEEVLAHFSPETGISSDEEVDRLKSEFLANISHELRTPLTAITGYADLMQKGMHGQVDEIARGCLERISDSADGLLALIDNLLALSYLEAGSLTVHPEQVDLTEFFTRVVAGVPAGLRNRPVRFISSLSPTLGAIHTDPCRLGQILDALLDNAVKFTPRGEIRLTARRIAVGSKGRNGGREKGDCRPPVNKEWIEMIVSDTGIGIPREKREIIFAEFRQVDASASRYYAGLGIGLTLCKKLVGLLGGSIQVESEMGKGSEFRVLLPTRWMN